jgi:predicted metal-dependent phosphoesterase TrpH
LSGGFVDLHTHSTRSDGSSTPTEVVERAAGLGLEVISLTDHDSVEGVEEAMSAAERLGVKMVAGAELSAHQDKRDIHILAYFVNLAHKPFRERLQMYRDERQNRAARIVKKLNSMGIRITFEQVVAKADGGAIGRPHVADVLVEEGFCFSSNEAFNKYLGYGKPAYQAKYLMDPSEAVEVIHDAGGIAVIAHPVLYGDDGLLTGLVSAGVDGIEVFHIKHTPTHVERYGTFARENGLLVSGGSDCHGDGRGQAVMGTVPVPRSVYDDLAEGWRSRVSV